ncbi:MAG TPA: hypothetical protein VGC45_14770 [Gryllotalpicola sp.]
MIAAVVGVNRIVGGAVVVSGSGLVRSSGRAIAHGIVSIVGGVPILAAPGRFGPCRALWVAAVRGILGFLRAVAFGRGAR